MGVFERLASIFGGGAMPSPVPSMTGPARRISARYDAGSTGTRRTRGWNPSDYGPVSASASLTTIRARARDAFRNDSFARAIVEAWIDDSLGWGFTPRSTAKDASVRDQLHVLWEAWSESAGSGGEDFAALTAAAVREVLVSGEVFIRLRKRRPEDGLPVPLALELVDPARVPVEMTETVDGGTVVQGVEFDKLGRVVGYHVRDYVPGEPMPSGASATPRRIPATAMLHVFDAERPGQVRGISVLATALPRLRLLDLWSDAVLLRQQLSNLFVGYLTNMSQPDDASVLTGLAPDATEDGRAVVELQPGIFQELNAGEEIKWSDPPDPPPSQDFGREQARLACGAAGVPLQVVSGEWGATNDRLARVVLNQWRRRVERFRWSVIVPRLLRPVWSRWVVLSGVAVDRAERGAAWRAHAWSYVHPVQDVTAQLAAVRGGLTSLSAVVAEGSGEDVETVLQAIARDNALADQLGLKLESDGRAAKGGAKQ